MFHASHASQQEEMTWHAKHHNNKEKQYNITQKKVYNFYATLKKKKYQLAQ